MSWRLFLPLYLLNLVLLTGVAYFQHAPGYMDAEYYLAGGERLVKGEGFSEPFLWNYLGDPEGVPRPSHAYWMPLASIIAAAGLALGGGDGFAAARIPFVLLGAAVAPLTSTLTWSITRLKGQAILAGILAAFSGFFLPRLPTTDTFALVMILGIIYLFAVGWAWQGKVPGWFLIGAAAGGLHLARAEGLLWLLGGIAAAGLYGVTQSRDNKRETLIGFLLVLAGYSLVMGPWIIRNLQVFGVPLSPGGGTALFQTSYDDLYHYPASDINLNRWLTSGWGNILKARWDALLVNLQTAAVVQAGVALLPFIAWGLWRLRRDARVKIGLAMWAVIFFVMTFVFPFSGARGGLFHAGAALQPLFWCAVPVGLEGFLEWGKRKRGWTKFGQARMVIGAILVFGAILISGAAVWRIVIGDHPQKPAWNQSASSYQQLDGELTRLNLTECTILMVNNPPGLYTVTGRHSIVIPDGDLSSVLEVGRRYGAEALLLDTSNPRLTEVYENPAGQEGLKYLDTVAGTHIFQILYP